MTSEIYFVCFRQSSLYISFKRYQKKVPSLPYQMQILNSSLNITLIQLSTHRNYFSFAYFNHSFDWVLILVFVWLFSLWISFNSADFTHINSCFNPFVFHVLLYIFFFSGRIAFSFLSWHFLVFRGLQMFSLFIGPIYFIFATNFWLG